MLMTKTAVAQMLGVSKRTLDRMRREGLLPSVRLRGCVRFELQDVHKLIMALRDGQLGHQR
jgi:excisionase family DNA binding protein